MKPQSAKAKGRNFQKWVRDMLIEHRDVHPEDIESRSMGAGGEDLIMARDARKKFPFSIECKNVEKLNVYDAYDQACANAGNHTPDLFMKKNWKKLTLKQLPPIHFSPKRKLKKNCLIIVRLLLLLQTQ